MFVNVSLKKLIATPLIPAVVALGLWSSSVEARPRDGASPPPVPAAINVGKYEGRVGNKALRERFALQERRKAVVHELFARCLAHIDADCALSLMTDDYKQHDPSAADGPAGIKAMIEKDRADGLTFINYIPLRTIAEGDYVFFHYAWGDPKKPEGVSMDLFRFEGEKLAEHWAVHWGYFDKLPASINKHGMF